LTWAGRGKKNRSIAPAKPKDGVKPKDKGDGKDKDKSKGETVPPPEEQLKGHLELAHGQ
jgi:hypothetical protein